MSKLNIITNILGTICVLAAIALPFTDKYQDWKQVAVLVLAGIALIYFKNVKLIQETIKLFK